MVFQKLREKRHVNRLIKRPLVDIEKEISLFKGNSVLAVTPYSTGNNWQGILSATIGLFGERVFQIPQYYSNAVYTDDELKMIGSFLAKNEAEHIVFSTYLPYFDNIFKELNKHAKKISVIYHGSHTSVLEYSSAADHFSRLTNLLRTGVLHKVGFVKKDMHKSFRKLTGQEFHQIHLKTDEEIFNINPIRFEGLNIGVLTHNNFRKNIYNMLSAGLLHEDAMVHVKDKYLSNYLGNEERLIVHGSQTDRIDFLKIMGGMDINYYVTFSECWGQFVNESLAMGVPCLTSDVSAVLDFDEELKNLLIVREFDNDNAIYMKSCEILENRDFFKSKGPQYIRSLNVIAEETLSVFVQ